MTAAIASDAEIVAAALACIKAGISIVPIDHRTKRPAMHLLPTGEDGKPTWMTSGRTSRLRLLSIT